MSHTVLILISSQLFQKLSLCFHIVFTYVTWLLFCVKLLNFLVSGTIFEEINFF